MGVEVLEGGSRGSGCGSATEVLKRVRSSGEGGKWIRKWIIDLGALVALWRGFGRSRRGWVTWHEGTGRFCGRVLKSAADGRQCRYYLTAGQQASCLTYDFYLPQRPDARSREVGVGHAEDGSWRNGRENIPCTTRIWPPHRAILTDFTSNPAIPTKTSHPKGSAKTLFY